MVHIVAPEAHRGPRTPRMTRCTWCWSMVAPRAHWGHVTHWMVRYTCHWHKVGWLWTHNVQKWIDLDEAHIVAPTAHWGTSTPWMARQFQNFWPKWIFFENFDQNGDFSKIVTWSEIFVNFDRNRDLPRISNKNGIFRKCPNSGVS